MLQPTFLIYGATGYTGQLITKRAVEAGLRPILGGRTAATLTPIANHVGLDSRVFGLSNAAEALAGVTALLNCAGPFSRTAGPLVEACLSAGVHYLDLAGEYPEFEALLARSEEAAAAGVMLLPGVGFGVVPTDCLAAHLQQRLPDAESLTLAFETVGGASQGTLHTILKDLSHDGVIRHNGQLRPAAPASRRQTIDLGNGRRSAVYNPWRGDLVTAFQTTGIPTIETYSVFPGPLVGLMTLSRRAPGLAAPLRGLLKRIVGWLPAGPNEKQLAAGASYGWGQATNASGQRVTARLSGPEAYEFTALTALAIVRRVLAGQVAPGFQTPAGLYGPDFVTEIPGVTLYS